MTFPVQKSFGDFIRERHGRNWVYAERSTPALLARYQKYNPDTGEHEPPAVITPKQQRQLAIDYAKAWGREHDPQYWQMLCALRYILATTKLKSGCGLVDIESVIEQVIDYVEKCERHP